MDYYWSDVNLEKDTYFKQLIHNHNDNGYVYISELMKWNKMREKDVREEEISEIAPYAENFVIDNLGIKIKKKV